MKLYGRNPVIERLKSNPHSIRKIYLEQGHRDGAYIRRKAQKWGLPVFVVPASKLTKMARNVNVQGVLAEVDGFLYVDYAELRETALKKKQTLVFLDGVTDPQNLGAAMRSLACFGGFVIVLPTHKSVDVTEAVLRVACGGENFLQIARVANLSQAVQKARDDGFWIIGTVTKDGTDITRAALTFPLGVIIGSEDKGIRPVMHKVIDQAVTIPMHQSRMSMNVAHATAVIAYEILRQRTLNT